MPDGNRAAFWTQVLEEIKAAKAAGRTTAAKSYAFSTCEFKALAGDDPTKTLFEGVASTPTPDRGNDSMDPKGAQFKLPMPFLYHHDSTQPIGQITEAYVTNKGIKVRGYVDKVDGPPTLKERLDVARVEMQKGLIRGLSIGWIPKGDLGDGYDFNKDGGLDVNTWEWVELSAVTIPMNAEATVTMVKSLANKSASGATDLPLSERDRAWDSSAADDRVRKWASSDGSGDKDKVNWAKYASAHFWTDPNNKEAFGGYKLGFADVVGGTLTAIWRGVTASAAVMQGSRGGVDIPDSDRAGVRGKIEAYYNKARSQYKDDSIQVPWASSGGSSAAQGIVSAPAATHSPTPGATGTQSTTGARNMTPQERVAGWEAKRASLAAAAAKILEIAQADGDRALTKDEGEEHDRLLAQVKECDTHLKRLRDNESILASPRSAQAGQAAAVPIPTGAGADPNLGSRARGGDISPLRPNDNLPKGMGMARYVKALAFAKGNYQVAIEYAAAQKHWENTPEVSLALKTAVAAGTTADSSWAGPLVYNQNLVDEFVNFLRPQTIIGKMTGFRRVPFNVRFPTQTSGSTVGWVGEGKAKPVSKFALSSGTLGFAKAAGIVVITMELARFSSPSAEMLVRDDLTAQMIEFLDQQFIDPGVAAVANVNPASITNGAGNISQSAAAWSSQANVLTDLKTFLQGFADNNIEIDGTTYWIMTPSVALALSMLVTANGQYAFPNIGVNGGTLAGIPVITSNSVAHSTSAGSNVCLVKASEVFLADDNQVAIDVSQEASLQMDTAPSEEVTTPTASTVVSMFQTNSLAIRVERVINWQRRRSYGVGYIDNVHTS